MNAPAPKIAQQLQSASRLLQAGDHVRARHALEQLLTSHPGFADAYWLLSGALLQGGDFARAESTVRTALQLAPHNPSAHALLGEIMTCQNRLTEADAALRQALALAPRHPRAISLYARLLMAQQRHTDTVKFIENRIVSGTAARELLLLRAQALLALKRFPDAITAFRGIIAATPNDAHANMGLIGALIENAESDAAETHIRAMIENGADGAEARFLLARALLAQNLYGDAEIELRNALRKRPGYTAAQTNLAELIWLRSADSDAATIEIDRALNVNPGDVQLRAFKAKLLEWAGKTEAALMELEAGLKLDRSNIALHLAAAQTALKYDAERALSHAEIALQADVRSPVLLSAYGNALLANGRGEDAIRISEQMLAINGHDGHAVALRASAWRMLGDQRYSALYNYSDLVRGGLIDIPPGWSSLHGYLRDLGDALKRRHTMRAHPIGQTLRTGTQIDLNVDLAREHDPAIQAFAQAIEGPIRRYLQAIGTGDDILRARNTGYYRLGGIWSVRLRSKGHHVDHYHPDGWLSSACYIELPESLGSHNGEGWIQFGESGVPTQPRLPAEYFVRPEPGLLVLFPAWMWHGTRPFSANESDARLTIAFDVVPA